MARLVACRRCATCYPTDARVCPECGLPRPATSAGLAPLIALALAVLLGGLLALSAPRWFSQPAEAPAHHPEPPGPISDAPRVPEARDPRDRRDPQPPPPTPPGARRPPDPRPTPPGPPIDVELLLREVDVEVQRWRFDAALRELTALARLTGGASANRVAARQAEVASYQALLDQLVTAIRRGPLQGHRLAIDGRPDLAIRLTDADRDGLRGTVASGQIGERWTSLSVDRRWALLIRAGLRERDWLTAAALLVEHDRPDLAEQALVRGWRHAPQREAIARRVAALRGTPLPADGFVLYRGRFVPPADRDQLARGLVRHGDSWVTRSDREHLRKGHVKQGGRWIARTPEQLRARGWRQLDGRWTPPAELARKQTQWRHGWRRTTRHWTLQTDHSRTFADQLAGALESAYAAHQRYFGRAPDRKPPLRMLAFRRFEDYQAYCKKVGHPEATAAAGFAPSEPRTACGYDKLRDRTSFLRTLIHESTHLYHQALTGANLPSWVAEGMATYFEGFDADGRGRLRFDHKPRQRLGVLKAAIQRGDLLTPAQMTDGRATRLVAESPSKALIFYSQAWGYYYFFHHTPDAGLRKAFRRYLDGLSRGARPDLERLSGRSWAELHRRFVTFARRL